MRPDQGDHSTTVRRLLVRDHERLDALFVQLLEAFRGGDWPEVRAMWALFDAGLLAHLDAEERYLLPLFAEANPAEAAALLEQHAAFRTWVAELGVGVDLHAVRLSVASMLIAVLRAHARREDQFFYRWLEQRVAPSRRGAPAEEPPRSGA